MHVEDSRHPFPSGGVDVHTRGTTRQGYRSTRSGDGVSQKVLDGSVRGVSGAGPCASGSPSSRGAPPSVPDGLVSYRLESKGSD